MLRTAMTPLDTAHGNAPATLAGVFGLLYVKLPEDVARVCAGGLTNQGEPGTMPVLSNKRLAESLKARRKGNL